MPISKSYQDQFRIFIFDEDLIRSEHYTEPFRNQGYSVATFSNREHLLETLNTQIPHIFLLFYQPLNLGFREIISKVRGQSDEVEIILLGSNEFWPGIKNLLQKDMINDFWSWPMASPESLQLRVDQVIEKIVFKYIAEQRTEETKQIVEAIDEVKSAQKFQAKTPSALVDYYNLPSEASTEAELIDQFISNLKSTYENSDFIYLKNYYVRDQLIVMKTSFSKETYFGGQTIPMKNEMIAEDRGNEFTELKEDLGKIFAVQDFVVVPLEFSEQIYGFIMAVHFPESAEPHLIRAARYASLSLRNIELEKSEKPDMIQRHTGLEIMKDNYYSAISREISRSRRIQKPVSMILAHIQFAVEHDKEKAEFIKILNDNLRIYDGFAQISQNEIAIILPHCSSQDAAIKAERIRRMVLHRGMTTQNTPLRICFGVTEFPSLSSDTDQMVMDVKAACDQVLASGNNKVCLFTAPADHEPEFTLL